jgi:hypothetical protein
MFNNTKMDFIFALTVSMAATLAFAPRVAQAAPVPASVRIVPATAAPALPVRA